MLPRCRSVVGLNVFGLMVTQTLGSVFRAVLLTTRTASVRSRAELVFSALSFSQAQAKTLGVQAACRILEVCLRHAMLLLLQQCFALHPVCLMH